VNRWVAQCVVWLVLPLSVVAGTAAGGASDSRVNAGDPDGLFGAFIERFPAELRTQARVIWQDTAGATAAGPATEIASLPEVGDKDLAAAMETDHRQAFLADVRQLRSQLDDAMARWRRTADALARWQAFVERVESVAGLGPVYLEALAVIRQLEAQDTAHQAEAQAIQRRIDRLRVEVALQKVATNFTGWDWLVIAVYLVFTTVLGGILAGRQADMKDFFLAGRKLPWLAVCGSIIATEVSAATFLIAPALVFSAGGDMTYIQLAVGTILARFVIGYFFVPAYYQRQIYSPYEYIGRRLGPQARHLTTGLFMVGGILAQGARVYIAGKALQVVTGTDMTTAIVLIGLVSIAWTVMGGIATVVWTDAIQCVLFIVGAVAALLFAAGKIDGGFAAMFNQAYHAGKLRAVNLSLDPHAAYTLWCGLIGFSVLTLASHGTDQLLVQRVFTCRGPVEARKAVVFSGLSQVLTYLLLFVGAGLFVYYKHVPMNAAERVIVDDDAMKVFAVYIVDVMPPALSGLLMAAIFATAISTLDSLLAALSQCTVAGLYKPFVRPGASDRHYVWASRVIVVAWGVVLTTFAIWCDVIARSYADLIQFALAMAAYTYGALLGTFLLAFLPVRRDGSGLAWAVPLAMLTVFALNWHGPAAQGLVVVAVLVLAATAWRRFRAHPSRVIYIALAGVLVWILGLAVVGQTADGNPVHITLAWPWHFPIGTAVTFVLGMLLGNRQTGTVEDSHG